MGSFAANAGTNRSLEEKILNEFHKYPSCAAQVDSVAILNSPDYVDQNYCSQGPLTNKQLS